MISSTQHVYSLGDRIWWHDGKPGRKPRVPALVISQTASNQGAHGAGQRVRIVTLRERWFWAGERKREWIQEIKNVRADRIERRGESVDNIDALANSLGRLLPPPSRTITSYAGQLEQHVEEVYLPDEETIRAEAAKIRATWSATETNNRLGFRDRDPEQWSVPEVAPLGIGRGPGQAPEC